jgi:cullin 3
MEACIVRIMKARRTLRYSPLVNEVIEQLQSRFRPSPGHIKKRIESLIDREFLERDENDR